MNTRDLFELATLDVLGLLDDQERTDFENAFRSAPPAIQAQVRAAQLRAANSEIEDFLPSVEAPVGLRAKVMAAVRDAIAAVGADPIARIGPGVTIAGFNSAPIWRAACIGFATASLVLAGFGYKVARDNRAIAEGSQGMAIMDNLIRAAGTRFPGLLADPKMVTVAFAPAAPDVEQGAVARLYYDSQKQVCYIFCEKLPAAVGSYSVVVQSSENSAPTSLKQFNATPGVNVVTLESVDPSVLRAMRILAPAASPQAKPQALLVASEL